MPSSVMIVWQQSRNDWYIWLENVKGWDPIGASDSFVEAMEFYDTRTIEASQQGTSFGMDAERAMLNWLLLDFDKVYDEFMKSIDGESS